MVCISCFIAPVVLFIWYKFIYPILQPLIDRFFTNYKLPQPFSNLSCPLPKKSAASCSMEKPTNDDSAEVEDEAASTGSDKKKVN